tara:strand:+ start:464 stop:766 length:303 start_codon:yes stop_codon:yes gene_type:complete
LEINYETYKYMNNHKSLPIIRGKCGICKTLVTTHDLRIKVGEFKYYHQKCISNRVDNVPILDQICSRCHKPISKLQEKILFNESFYHKNLSQCKIKKYNN